MAIDLHDVFLHKMPTLLLLAVGERNRTYISVVAKECNCTYPHAVKILHEMEQYGLIKSEKLGRIKYVTLTDFGRAVESSLKQLIKTLGATDKYIQDDLSYVDLKVDNIINKVNAIRQTLRQNQRLSVEEITKVSRRLGPYYRELKIVEGLAKVQPKPNIAEKVSIAKSELAEAKADIASKRTKV